MSCWHIHIQGQVQGVGFRPFVYRLAMRHSLSGSVWNGMDGVRIEIVAVEKTMRQFVSEIETESPPNSIIRTIDISKKEISKNRAEQKGFEIVHSNQTFKVDLLLTPDFAMCANCRKELHAKSNQRHQYPFITCTQCGPRYSLIESLPYDRERTVMKSFEICNVCKAEYFDHTDRRYFSQTNSCQNCGIELALYNYESQLVSKDNHLIYQRVIEAWQKGSIVAIKGIGGYLLTCDASNESSIKKLRLKKHRLRKPFAVMYPDLEGAIADVDLNNEASTLLAGAVSPIVLLPLWKSKNTNKRTNPALQSITSGLSHLGVMIPYAPLFEILLRKYNRAIIATSGNISHEPIIYKDEKAIGELTEIADFVLIHNREIVVPQDDSVVKFTPHFKKKIIIRRSRGLAPSMFSHLDVYNKEKNYFAAGAMLKSTFTFTHGQNTFVSQYLGDLQSFETERHYLETRNHFFNLFNSTPDIILCDLHPEYPSTRMALELSEELQVPLIRVPHHEAHFASILAEYNVIESNEPILGVIWDGVGFGTDGNLWGGEFFRYENYDFERIDQLPYFGQLAGDKMSKEPRVSLMSLAKNIGDSKNLLKNKFSENEWLIYQSMRNKEDGLKTSSVGRLFDAVASLLGLCDIQEYEGEAAMYLEDIALEYFKENGLTLTEYYHFLEKDNHISIDIMLKSILNDLNQSLPIAYISAKFHLTLVHIIGHVTNKTGINTLAFSGGVFQNAILVDLIVYHLGKKNKLLFHQMLSPNDENISFGQVAHYVIKNKYRLAQTEN